MAKLESSQGQKYVMADCVTCADRPEDSEGYGPYETRWARRHAEKNPGHEVHIVSESTRIYRFAALDAPAEVEG